jgi:hypothetical protein
VSTHFRNPNATVRISLMLHTIEHSLCHITENHTIRVADTARTSINGEEGGLG